MSLTERLFTPTEAAVISGLGLKAINNAIDKRVVKAARPAAGPMRGRRRMLAGADLVFVALWYDAAGLSEARRRTIIAEVKHSPPPKFVQTGAFTYFDLQAATKGLEANAKRLALAEALVTTDPDVMGGEPVFKGTRIPVRAIAATLEGGASEAEILEAYTALDKGKLELGRIWAAAHPRRGRPKSLAEKGFTFVSESRRPWPPAAGPDEN